MEIPVYKIKVRWSDLDANMHLANSSYLKFTSHLRIEKLTSFGLSLQKLNDQNIGPVILHEEISYFKEVLPSEDVYISTEITGFSINTDLVEFSHNFYSKNGIQLAKSYIIGTWIDLKTRKKVILPKSWIQKIKNNATKNPKELNLRSLLSLIQRPKNIDSSKFKIIS